MIKILQISRKKEIIGGITSHVFALNSRINNDSFAKSVICEPKYNNSFRIVKHIINSDIIHLHSTNFKLALFVLFFSKLFRKKSVFTYHSNLQKKSKIYFKILLFDKIIVLNNHSYSLIKYHKNVIKLNSYVKSMMINNTFNEYELSIKVKINKIKQKKENKVFHTYTNKNIDIYGIHNLINLFEKLPPNYFLFISDPYKQVSLISRHPRIFILDESHDLSKIFFLFDCYIRNTNTDGDAVAIYEALNSNISVFATNICERPFGTILYDLNDMEFLKIIILNFERKTNHFSSSDAYFSIKNVYKSLI